MKKLLILLAILTLGACQTTSTDTPPEESYNISSYSLYHTELPNTPLLSNLDELPNFPAEDGGKLIANTSNSSGDIFFSVSYGGGLFYQTLYSLNLNSPEDGFKTVESFFAYPHSHYGHLDDQSKINQEAKYTNRFMIGYDEATNAVTLIDFENPTEITELFVAPEGRSFFEPGLMGEDPINAYWKDALTLEITTITEEELEAAREKYVKQKDYTYTTKEVHTFSMSDLFSDTSYDDFVLSFVVK